MNFDRTWMCVKREQRENVNTEYQRPKRDANRGSKQILNSGYLPNVECRGVRIEALEDSTSVFAWDWHLVPTILNPRIKFENNQCPQQVRTGTLWKCGWEGVIMILKGQWLNTLFVVAILQKSIAIRWGKQSTFVFRNAETTMIIGKHSNYAIH